MKKIYRSYRKKNAPQAFLRSCLSRARVVLKGAVCERARQIPQRDTLYFHFTQMRKFVNPFCMIFCCGRVEAASLERGAPAASGRPAPKKQKQNKKRAAIASFRLTAGGLFLPAPHGSLPRLADRGQCSSFCRNFVLPTDGRQPLCPLPKGAPSSGRMRSLQASIAYHTGSGLSSVFGASGSDGRPFGGLGGACVGRGGHGLGGGTGGALYGGGLVEGHPAEGAQVDLFHPLRKGGGGAAGAAL